MLAALYALWVTMEERAKEEVVNLTRMRDELGAWFLPDNPFAIEVAERIEKVLAIAIVPTLSLFSCSLPGACGLKKTSRPM